MSRYFETNTKYTKQVCKQCGEEKHLFDYAKTVTGKPVKKCKKCLKANRGLTDYEKICKNSLNDYSY